MSHPQFTNVTFCADGFRHHISLHNRGKEKMENLRTRSRRVYYRVNRYIARSGISRQLTYSTGLRRLVEVPCGTFLTVSAPLCLHKVAWSRNHTICDDWPIIGARLVAWFSRMKMCGSWSSNNRHMPPPRFWTVSPHESEQAYVRGYWYGYIYTWYTIMNDIIRNKMRLKNLVGYTSA